MQALGLTWRKLTSNVRHSGPIPQMKQLFKVAFSDKYLLCTNVTISVSLSAVGDILAQQYEIFIKGQETHDWKRTMHMGCSGAAVGVLCHNWYKVLDRVIVGKTLKMISIKLFLDQLIFSPIMIITFFGTVALFEDKPMDNFKEEVTQKFLDLYRAEWMVWPPAQIINFYFLPTKYRVLYDNTISLGYDVYTSQVKYRNKKAEPSEELSKDKLS